MPLEKLAFRAVQLFNRFNLNRRRLLIGTSVAGLLILLWGLSQIPWRLILAPLQNLVLETEMNYQQWLQLHQVPPLALLPLAFTAGLIASVSPCILALLPLNLTYIGTRSIASRRDALMKAIAFVLGVVTTLSLLGLFSGVIAGSLLRMQGYLQAGIGALIILMGLSLSGCIQMPLPPLNLPSLLPGPYGFGLTFALLTSPCSSPLLFAILGAAMTTGSEVYSTLTLVSYAFGYTAVIFLASVFTGFATRSRSLLARGERLNRLGGIALMAIGGYYLVTGLDWIIARFRLG